jgi:hypothetical protein
MFEPFVLNPLIHINPGVYRGSEFEDLMIRMLGRMGMGIHQVCVCVTRHISMHHLAGNISSWDTMNLLGSISTFTTLQVPVILSPLVLIVLSDPVTNELEGLISVASPHTTYYGKLPRRSETSGKGNQPRSYAPPFEIANGNSGHPPAIRGQ